MNYPASKIETISYSDFVANPEILDLYQEIYIFREDTNEDLFFVKVKEGFIAQKLNLRPEEKIFINSKSGQIILPLDESDPVSGSFPDDAVFIDEDILSVRLEKPVDSLTM